MNVELIHQIKSDTILTVEWCNNKTTDALIRIGDPKKAKQTATPDFQFIILNISTCCVKKGSVCNQHCVKNLDVDLNNIKVLND